MFPVESTEGNVVGVIQDNYVAGRMASLILPQDIVGLNRLKT